MSQMEHTEFKCYNMRQKVSAAGRNSLCFLGWILLTLSEIVGKELEFFNATEASFSLKLSLVHSSVNHILEVATFYEVFCQYLNYSFTNNFKRKAKHIRSSMFNVRTLLKSKSFDSSFLSQMLMHNSLGESLEWQKCGRAGEQFAKYTKKKPQIVLPETVQQN